ncbi:PhnE/PtxC family ABC transporter permease [Paracoccus kondratievae]|uniref:Phosphate ABC transporter permease n=1 Tax=Paracoccus kondratievae TaxID=135740 RepID=A0AAD3NSR9_9RHOB|nr:ABC transporter permease [Paracoccus kondratievae]GLK62996.1 phosphate ABC transporter permease [Paracoccus kondratievae]
MLPTSTISMPAEREAKPSLRRLQVVWIALTLAALALFAADLQISAPSPGAVLKALAMGFARPDFAALENLGQALLLTLTVAFGGVAIGAVAGFAMALLWGWRAVRMLSLSLRSVHELIWALFIMTVTGPEPIAAVLALALSYSGIFAKVFGEILDEADPRPRDALPGRGMTLSGLIYARLVPSLPAFWSYFCYRIECGIRSSAVLGFVGLPTLGFELDTLFKQGRYDGAAAVLLLTYALILSQSLWLRRRLVPLYVLGALAYLASLSQGPVSAAGLWQLIGVDMVPAPLRGADPGAAGTWRAFGDWLWRLVSHEVLPGAWATVLVSYLAFVLCGIIALFAFPLIVPALAGRIGSGFGHVVLVILRSTPEYMLVFVGVQVFGPSMLPAVLALGLHNGAIIAHLIGREATRIVPGLRPDRPKGAGLYAYELVPRVSSGLIAYLFYRGEIILRESMILGILGIATLGFYVDSAIATLRFDRAAVLVVAMMLLTALVDWGSRALRRRLRVGAVSTRPYC